MPGGTGGPTARALEAWATAQPSLWDTAAIAAASVMAPLSAERGTGDNEAASATDEGEGEGKGEE